MKLGESGEAFFVEGVTPGELGDEEIIPPHLACSPIPDDFLLHFHGREATSTEIHDNTHLNADLDGKNVDITCNGQQNRFEEVQGEVSVADQLSKDSSQVQDQVPNEDGSAESFVTKENIESQKPVIVTAGTSFPKTFCAETVCNDDDKSEKLHRISIVAGDFRPISLIVEDDVPAISNDGLLMEDVLDGQSATEDSSSYQEQASSHGLLGKDSGKEISAPGNEDLLKPNAGGKRKRRRKSLMKKKSAAQKRNSVGSNSHIEQCDANDTNGLAKTSGEMQQAVMDDSPDQGVFQMEDLNSQAEGGPSSQEVCSLPFHMNL
jgi:phosphatidate phosphatase LPIN